MENYNENQSSQENAPAALENEVNNGKKKQKPKKTLAREFAEWIQAIVIALVLALVVRNFVFTVVKVDGQSMEPTLHNNDRMIVWRMGYEPEAGDIIVFNPPGYPEKTYWIKRVIATEGQTVKIDYDTNSVYVDGQKLHEIYLDPTDKMIDMGFAVSEIVVPEDCIFVLGDNRNHSTDGRVIGPVNEDRVVGEAVLRFWPFGSIQTY